jgi:hypothetical protein
LGPVLLGLILLGSAATGCGGTTQEPRASGEVREISVAEADETASGHPHGESGPGNPELLGVDEPAGRADTSENDMSGDDSSGHRDLAPVVKMMRAFDSAVTELAANPMAGADGVQPNPALTQWHAAVKPDSPADRDLRARFITEFTTNRTVYLPRQTGPHAAVHSWIHTVIDVTPEAVREPAAANSTERTVQFTYCGYSPAFGRNADTNEVVDDDRATYMGNGRAVVSGGTALLIQMADGPVRLLADHEDNPC